MAWRQFSAKPWSEAILSDQLHPWEQKKCNFNQNSNIFIQENAFENVICKMAYILHLHQYVLVLILNPLLDFFLYIKLMCPYFILLTYTDGERDGLWMACPFRTLVVLYRMFPFIICLILMNYLMEFYFIGFVNAHLPGCFCPWTFRLNIGLNTSPSDSFVSYLNSHLGYSAGEFQALQLIVLAVFGAVD